MKLKKLAKKTCIHAFSFVLNSSVPSVAGNCFYHGSFDSESGACPRCND
ncbi:hypothetical protein [Amycolatopsis sp. RTGN1]|nr:hypothetical protein [Amycolatopsis sp. RTGN1]